ncbi:MAG: domain S-box protein [Polaromonas sp.]|nr:domain S-box protein [Polaromonas sp.]
MYRSPPAVSLPVRYLGLAFAQRLTAAPRMLRYSIGATFFLIALLARFELVQVLPAKGFPFLTFFPAVLLTAYLAGLGPGLLTSVLSALGAYFFFIQPDRSLPLTGPDMVALAFFSAILLIDCVVLHVMKTALGRVSRTEQHLRHSSQRLQLVLDNLNMYVGVLDLEGILREVNEEPLRVTGLRQEDILGRPLWDAPWWADDVDRQNEVRAAIGRAAAGETVRFDIQVQRSGQKFTIDFQVGPKRDSDKKVTALVASGVNVTARVNALAALQQSRQDALVAAQAAEADRRLLDATFNAVPAGIIVADANGKLLRMNRANEQIWGMAPFSADVAGYGEWKGWWADGSARHGQRIQPDEWGLARSLQGDYCSHIVEVEPFGRPDERRVTLLSSAPVLSPSGQVVGGVAAQIDITARIQAEKAWRLSEARFRALFDRGPIAIFSCDSEGIIQEFNPCAVLLWGREPKRGDSSERYCGSYKLYLPDGTFVPRGQTPMAAVLRGEMESSHDQQVIVERPDGSCITIMANTVALKNEQGQLTGAMCCFYDITERSRLEQKTREQAKTLADLDRRKDEFLAMLSHELRNPLAPISNAVQLLGMQDNEGPVQKKARLIIERQLGQLNHLVDDLLEVSRITSGSVRLRPQRISVNGVVERALETAQPLILLHRHELTVSLPPEPVFLQADAARLEQVLVNLLTNAAKYTLQGGRIWLSIEQERDAVVIKVRDTGIGIAPELLPHIFELFTQAERSLDRSQGGMGIGLCLVQRLVELHGGCVTVHSVLGQGSDFTVRLPLAREAPPAMAAPVPDTAPPPAHGRRVLVVDDNVDAAQSLALLLEMSGHEVRLAHDGLGALEAVMAHPPDVVLLDIGLPQLDGYEVARRIRQQYPLQHIRLVALTGYGQGSDRQRSLEAGFDHHLVKPANFAEIEKILHTAAPPAKPA